MKEPQNSAEYFWTMHSKKKLFQYALSPGIVKRILRFPDRKEEGIAEDTIAVMKDRSTKSTEKEVWVMYQQERGRKKKIISTWVYPGKSPRNRKEIFIPEDALAELRSNGLPDSTKK